MNKKQIEKAQSLEREGYSQREIAGLLGVPLTTVNRSLKAEREASLLTGDDDGEDETANVPTAKKQATGADVQIVEAQLRHEREMTKLNLEGEQTKAEQELKREQIRNESQATQARLLEAENQREQLKQYEAERTAEETKEEQRIDARKALLVGKFTRLVREILHNCKEATWNSEDVNDFNERAEALLKKLIKFCGGQAIDEEELALYHNLKALLKFWEETKEECTGMFSDDVELDLKKNKIAEIRTWLIEDFQDEPLEDEEDDESDEDEEDEENEENDNDDDESPTGLKSAY